MASSARNQGARPWVAAAVALIEAEAQLVAGSGAPVAGAAAGAEFESPPRQSD